MVRLILVMHEPLGSALAECARHVLGQAPELTVIDFKPTDQPEKRLPEVLQVLTQSPVLPVLILSDLFGATPFNTARKALDLARSEGVEGELLAGANLCMVLKALTSPQDDFHALLRSVRASATRGIVCAGDPP